MTRSSTLLTVPRASKSRQADEWALLDGALLLLELAVLRALRAALAVLHQQHVEVELALVRDAPVQVLVGLFPLRVRREPV